MLGHAFIRSFTHSLAQLTALGLVSMMLHYVNAKTDVLVRPYRDAQDLSCTYLAHHELESVKLVLLLLLFVHLFVRLFVRLTHVFP